MEGKTALGTPWVRTLISIFLLYQAGSGELRRGLDDEELLESRELKELLHRLTERGEGNAATRRAKVSVSGKKDPETGTADIG